MQHPVTENGESEQDSTDFFLIAATWFPCVFPGGNDIHVKRA